LNAALALGAIALIVAIELPPLVRKKMWGEVAAFSILMLIGSFLSLALALGIKLPNPTEYLMTLLQPFSDLIYLR